MRKSKSLTALRLWLRYRHDRKVLARLDDRTLRGLGLSRSGLGFAERQPAR